MHKPVVGTLPVVLTETQQRIAVAQQQAPLVAVTQVMAIITTVAITLVIIPTPALPLLPQARVLLVLQQVLLPVFGAQELPQIEIPAQMLQEGLAHRDLLPQVHQIMIERQVLQTIDLPALPPRVHPITIELQVIPILGLPALLLPAHPITIELQVIPIISLPALPPRVHPIMAGPRALQAIELQGVQQPVLLGP